MKLVPLFPDAETVAARTRWRRRAQIALIVAGALACLVGGALVAVRELWPGAKLVLRTSAVAQVQVARIGETIAAVRVVDASGKVVRVTDRKGTIEPVGTLAPGTRLTVTATVHRSKWIGWLVGATSRVEAVTRAPATYLRTPLVYAAAGKEVKLRFSAPVRKLSVTHPDGTRAILRFRRARRQVPIGVVSTGATAAGTALVAATPRLWERLPQPVRVTWFPDGPDPQVLVRPAPKSSIVPSGPIVLTFSRPITAVLGEARPAVRPRTAGSWREPNDHTLVFDPSGLGYPLGESVQVVFPRAIQVIAGADPAAVRTLSWNVPAGSTNRLKQLLADQGYLPFTWSPSGAGVPLTLGAQATAAVDPPAGTLTWRYAQTPQALKALWNSATQRPVLVQGAIMAFESRHGMPLYPYATRALWRALLRDEVAGRKATSGYSYVFVTETLPETLTLWHNGHVILRTAVNTGISSRPTALGTYPVYAHLTETTMQGTNPDGTHYDDPGVPWVNYFHGGDAVHGFVRPGYGYPQSLGCVEAPPTTAGQIFPYVNVGTLVTVAPPAPTAT